MQRPPERSGPADRRRRPAWPIVVGASIIVGLLAGGLIGLDARDTALPQPPTGLAATAGTCAPPRCDGIVSTVTLVWNAPADPGITGFRVVRDGTPLPDAVGLSAATTQWIDHDVTAGDRHSYEVIASASDGTSPPSAGVDALVPLPPLRAAQLGGIYDVTLVVRRASNLRSLSGIPTPKPGERRASMWGFQPLCEAADGPCPTDWTGRSGVLRPRGTVWTGRVQGPDARCADGTREPSPIDLHLRVRDAAMIAGAWIVVGFTGVYSVGFHCPGFLPSRGTLDVSGHHH